MNICPSQGGAGCASGSLRSGYSRVSQGVQCNLADESDKHMDKFTISASLSCGNCGATVTINSDADENSTVACSNPDCDTTFGTWGDVRKMVREKTAKKAKDDIVASLRKSLRKK